jgi:hypothetical protein
LIRRTGKAVGVHFLDLENDTAGANEISRENSFGGLCGKTMRRLPGIVVTKIIDFN